MLQNVHSIWYSLVFLLIVSDLDMATGDINNILSRLSKIVYITQEVIWGSGEPITPAEYTQNGQLSNHFFLSPQLNLCTQGDVQECA